MFRKATKMRRAPLAAIILVLTVVSDAQVSGRNVPTGESVIGKVIAQSKDSLTIAPIKGGDPVIVKVTDSTRVTKERQPFRFADIKVGDVVFARGELNSNSMQAAMVGVVSPEMAQRLEQGGTGRMMADGVNPEDLGKKFIAGEVKAINETKLTIARPDGQTQEIEVDENTSFKKAGESITLPDIKVGDFVRGHGELKDNVFIPKELIVGRPQMRFGTNDRGAQGQEKKPPSATPAETPAATPPK